MKKEMRCVSDVPDGGRMATFHQCLRKGVVKRVGQLYCRQHDPVAMKERDKKWVDEQAADDAIEKEGLAVAKRLGAGVPHWQMGLRSRDSGYTRKLIITFKEAERLIERLK